MRSLDELVSQVSELLDSGALISFHDAHRLVRCAKQLGEPRNSVVLGLLALHDGHSTDGAKALFTEYLRSAGARLQAQSELAERPIVLRDSGKIARSAPGQTLLLELEEKRTAGLRWHVTSLEGPGSATRRPNQDEAAPRARFEVQFRAPGLVHIELQESKQDGPAMSHAHSRQPTYAPRKMTLTVIVEVNT
ncbi:MAG: hypothetical protein AAFQ82_15725 [Myxococcota bacterium]